MRPIYILVLDRSFASHCWFIFVFFGSLSQCLLISAYDDAKSRIGLHTYCSFIHNFSLSLSPSFSFYTGFILPVLFYLNVGVFSRIYCFFALDCDNVLLFFPSPSLPVFFYRLLNSLFLFLLTVVCDALTLYRIIGQ